MFLSRKAGIKWTNRGNVSTADYQKANFTVDSDYHLKDISAIVGKGRKLVSFLVSATTTMMDGQVILFNPDNTEHVNVSSVFVPAYVQACQTLWVYTNANGEIGYCVTLDPVNTYLDITINGWLD